MIGALADIMSWTHAVELAIRALQRGFLDMGRAARAQV